MIGTVLFSPTSRWCALSAHTLGQERAIVENNTSRPRSILLRPRAARSPSGLVARVTCSSQAANRAGQSGTWRLISASMSRISPESIACDLLFWRVHRDVGFVGIVEISEHPVILLLRQRVVLVAMALGTLDGQAQDAFADAVRADRTSPPSEIARVRFRLLRRSLNSAEPVATS